MQDMKLFKVTAEYRTLVHIEKVWARNAADAGERIWYKLEVINGEDVRSLHAEELKPDDIVMPITERYEPTNALHEIANEVELGAGAVRRLAVVLVRAGLLTESEMDAIEETLTARGL